MLEARMKEASLLKKLLDAVKELVTDANFECNDEGISLQAMDNSHVALVSVQLKSEGFESYRCDRNMPLGMNLASLTKILKCAKDSDIITLKASDNADLLTLLFENAKSDRVAEYEMKLMDIDQEHLGIPDTPYACTVSMSSSEFQKICRDLMSLGESVKIDVSKEGVRFSAEGEIGNAVVLLKATGGVKTEKAIKDEPEEEDDEDESPVVKNKKSKPKVKKEKMDDGDAEEVEDDDEEGDKEVEENEDEEEEDGEEDDEEAPKKGKRKAPAGKTTNGQKAKKSKTGDDEDSSEVTITMSQSVSLTFSLKYLLNFAKSAPLANRVTLQLSNDVPLLVGFNFDSGDIKYFLAPKIGDE